ncbi:MAG: tyrosine-protein kinase family protein [Promethearchaeota archaeon]
MTTTLTVHSAKGGAGKTTIAVNIAVILAELFPQGKILIIDFDVYSPSIHEFLPPKNGSINHYLADFLTTESPIQEVIYQSQEVANLYVIYSDYIKDFENAYLTDPILWTKVFWCLNNDKVRQYLLQEFTFIIYDNLPGFHLVAATALRLSDIGLLVLDVTKKYEVEGTVHLLEALYTKYVSEEDLRLFTIVNGVPPIVEPDKLEEGLRPINDYRAMIKQKFPKAFVGSSIVVNCDCKTRSWSLQTKERNIFHQGRFKKAMMHIVRRMLILAYPQEAKRLGATTEELEMQQRF